MEKSCLNVIVFFLKPTDNLSEVWEQLDMLKEGLQQVNSSLQMLTSHIHIGGFTPTPSPTNSSTEIVPSPSQTVNSSSSVETGV